METMKFSIHVMFATYVCNMVWICVMLYGEWIHVKNGNMPPRGSIIPGTNQKFMYMQDWFTCTWGDMFALPLVLNAFVTLAVNGRIAAWEWILSAMLAVILGVGFLLMCLGKDHKPDQGYPEIGVVSLQGILHLPHFGVAVAMVVVCVGHAIFGGLRGPVLYTAIVGGVLWVVTFVLDAVTGHFDPIKRVDPNSPTCVGFTLK